MNEMILGPEYGDAIQQDAEDEDYSHWWICVCGNYTDHCHCPTCRHEAPWGCDCGANDRYPEDGEYDYAWEAEQ